MRTGISFSFKNSLIVSFLTFFLFAGRAEAAYLYFSPSGGTFGQNENFKVGVFVDADENINAVQGVVAFPTEYLGVIGINSEKSGSIVDLWVRNPSFSNAGETGNVYFEGVSLNPGFTGPSGKIMEITFRAKKIGTAEIGFSDFAILANDGLGTNVSRPNGNAVFSIIPGKPAAEQESSESIKAIEKKIKSVETNVNQRIDDLNRESEGVLGFWYILPKWVRVSFLFLVGVTALVLALALLLLAIIVSIWLINYLSKRQKRYYHWLSLLPKTVKKIFRKAIRIARKAEEEMGGDITYAEKQIKEDLREASGEVSFSKLMADYRDSLKRIFKRFMERNKK